jgi:hypothetical protein
MSRPAVATDEQQIPVRLQVVGVEAKLLDALVPTYLPMRDVSQRIARDAGLNAWWPDGTRRLYWVRARGRVLGDDERLADVGIVPLELLHVLPQPPPDTVVVERSLELRMDDRLRAAQRAPRRPGLVLVGALLGVGGWSVLWALALSVQRDPWTAGLPAMGLALGATDAARSLWVGPGERIRIPLTAGTLSVVGMLVAFGLAWHWGAPSAALLVSVGVAAMAAMTGLSVAWVAWLGAVDQRETLLEPLPQGASPNCAICAGPVNAENAQGCAFKCGKVFHRGCWQARQAAASGAGCAVCGHVPAAAR